MRTYITCGIRVSLYLLMIAGRLSAADMTAPGDNGTLGDSLRQLVEHLESLGYTFDSEQGEEELVGGIIKLADPHGFLIQESSLDELQRWREGVHYSTGLQLSLSNNLWYIEGEALQMEWQEGEWATGRGALLKLAGQAPEDIEGGAFAMNSLLRERFPETVTVVWRDDRREAGVLTQRVERVRSVVSPLDVVEELPFNLGYVRLFHLGPETGSAVSAVFEEWTQQEMVGVLLDLRGAGGEHTEGVREIAEWLAHDQQFLFAFENLRGEVIENAHARTHGVLNIPVMVLIDTRTTGAAELLAAVLRDSVRGTMLFGEETASDPLLRDIVRLPDNRSAYLLTRWLRTGTGIVYDGRKGVLPDVRVSRSDPSREHQPVRSGRTALLDEEVEQERLFYRTRRDAALRRAIDVLLGLKALDIRPRTDVHVPLEN